MKEANNYNSIILSYGLTLKSALAVQKAIYRESGVVAYMLPRDDTANDENLSYVYQKAFENSVGFQIGGDFVAEHKIAEQQGFKKWCGKVVVWGWTINNAGYYNDCYDIWAQMYELGYRMIMNNNNLELVKFASTKI